MNYQELWDYYLSLLNSRVILFENPDFLYKAELIYLEDWLVVSIDTFSLQVKMFKQLYK